MRAKFVDCGAAQYRLWQDAQRQFHVPVDVNLGAFEPADLPRMLDGYDIAISDHTRFPPEVLQQCGGLRHFIYFGTGAASILDLTQAERMGIRVHTIRNYGDTTVAELCVGLIMAAARQIAEQHLVLRHGGWKKLQGMELRGRRAGLVGFGGIGREVARICQGIGMEVVAWNRSTFADENVYGLALDELLATSDVVSLHLGLDGDQGLFELRAAACDEARGDIGQYGARRIAGRGSVGLKRCGMAISPMRRWMCFRPNRFRWRIRCGLPQMSR